ncbi:MAG TPA: pyridoxal phosphate-dependent aminotransferase [Polyangiaceae bacterium]|nr:pyridoxal phosphate-dependent aminotransferase [Polyangiaceae bacterium]
MFSRRSSRDQSPNAVAATLGGRRPAFDLTSSNPTTAGLGYGESLLVVLERAQARSLVYAPEPFGLRSAREAVAAVTGVPAPDVVLSASTSEAYSFLFKLLCDPGDAVLVPAPSYPLFEHLAELEAVQVQSYRLAYDGAWHVDLDSLRRAVTPRTRAIISVSPNNPTGQYLSASERLALESLGAPVIYDEVFAEFPFHGAAPAAPRSTDTLTFTLDGLSKRAGSPQLKLGWTLLSGSPRARDEARQRLELIADTFLSVGTPIQQALPELLALCPAITQSIAARCRSNWAALVSALEGSPVSLLHAEAGWSAVLQLPRVQSEEQLVLGLLDATDVLVQPGWFYDFESEPFAVVSLLTEPRVFREGIARLARYMSRVVA